MDLLTAIGPRVFLAYETEFPGQLGRALYDELDAWGRRVQESIEETGAGLVVEAQADGGVNFFGALFAKMTAKSKAEASSRTKIREVLEPQLTDLLDKINLIAEGIQAKTQKEVLVFVDDTDKPLQELATRLFKDHLAPLLEPNMHVIYTVPVWMCFSDEFPEIRSPDASVLPNVKLYERNAADTIDPNGLETMKEFISARMDSALIDDDAAELAIVKSGGVYRETARIFQLSIDRALEDHRTQVMMSDVESALNELTRDFRGLITDLDPDQIKALRAIGENRAYRGGERIGRFLNNLLVSEYGADEDENWPDLNPLLRDVLT